MKQKILKIIALFSMVVLTYSLNSFAAINMTDTTADAVTFATEIDVNATTGTDLAESGTIFKTTAAIGFGQAVGETYYVRFDLSNNAEFKANPTLDCDGDAGTLSAGGAGESYAIYSVTVAGDTHTTAELAVLTVVTGITVENQSSVTISYSMYETAGNAVNQTSALATDSEVMINWDAALDTTVTAVTSDKIDVTTASLSFTNVDGYGTDTTMIGDVNIDVDGTTLWTDGLAAAMTDLVAAGTTLVLTGDFNAALASTNGVYIDAAGNNCGTVGTASTETATTATFALGTTPVVGANASICMQVDEATTIGTGAITGVYTVTPAASSDLGNQTLTTLTTLEKNGASDTINFLLKPTSSFTNLVRITNSGTTTGDVFLTLINDAGASKQINLGDVAGVASSSLASGASTGYINVSAIYDAVQAADATFTNNNAQLRLNVSSTCTEIIANAFAMSKDGNVFTVIDSVDNASN